MPAPPLLPSPWRLSIPTGPTVAADGIRDSVNTSGQYRLTEQGSDWLVERLKEPPQLWSELRWMIHRLGETGSKQALIDHLSSWPFIPGGDDKEAAGIVQELEQCDKPDDPIKWAQAARYATDAIMTASPTSLPSIAERVAKKLLDWFPNGQMLVWGKSHEYQWAGRPAHLLAGAELIGLDEVAEGIKSGKGAIWMRGEDVLYAHVGSLYVNLANSEEMPGWAFETATATFVFEFATNVAINPSLDFLSIRYLNSLPVLDYLPGNLPETSAIIQLGFVGQEKWRSWFLDGINRVADHLIRWENFMNRAGSLRPVAQQSANMTVSRILNTTAQLLAFEERSSRLMAFWDLVDLYNGLTGPDIPRLFSRRYWYDHIVLACKALPEHQSGLFVKYATELYEEWVQQCIQGITNPNHVFSDTVQIVPGGPRIPHDNYFGRHLDARRNTLHGYDLSNSTGVQYLGIHDGSLPQRLPEWGRLMLLALLADPSTFLARFRRLTD